MIVVVPALLATMLAFPVDISYTSAILVSALSQVKYLSTAFSGRTVTETDLVSPTFMEMEDGLNTRLDTLIVSTGFPDHDFISQLPEILELLAERAVITTSALSRRMVILPFLSTEMTSGWSLDQTRSFCVVFDGVRIGFNW